MAIRTLGLSRVASQHHAVLNLITPFAQIVKKEIDADISAMPAFLE